MTCMDMKLFTCWASSMQEVTFLEVLQLPDFNEMKSKERFLTWYFAIKPYILFQECGQFKL